MSEHNAPTAEAVPGPPSRTGSLPSYPRQTEPGHYGPRKYGPNGFAIVAFVVGLAGGSLLGIVLACVALGKIRDTGQSGKALAVAGLVLSVLWLPVEIYALLGRT